MASNTQQEYNRLRAELDKFKRENRVAGGQAFGDAHAAYSKKVSGLQKKIDALKPALAKQTYTTSRLPQRSAAQVASSLKYSDDPNSPFQKALLRIKSDAEAKKIEDSKRKEISDLEEGYLSDQKAKEDSLRSQEKKAKDAAKASEEAAKLKTENAIRVSEGKKPKPTPPPKGQTVTSDTADPLAATNLIAKNQKKYELAQAEKDVLLWAGTVRMSSGKTVSGPRPGSSFKVPDHLLVADAVRLFITDPKLQDKVIQTIRNSGKENVSQEEAYVEWDSTVRRAAELALSGKGLILTPMELLNMRNKPSGGSGGPSTSVNKSIIDYTSAQLGTIVDTIFQENLGKDPSAAQRSRYILEFQKGVAKGNVTTTVTNGRNSTTTTKRGFSQERAAADLGAKLKSSPEYATPYKQKQSLEFNDAITRLMQGGI